MKQPTKKQRIALTVSAVWILVVIVTCEGSRFPLAPFIIFGILPVLIGWTIWWISRVDQQADRVMNAKRGFRRITFALAAVAALSGTAIGVYEVIACYENAGWYDVFPEDYSGIEPPYWMIGTIDRAEQARAELRRRAAIRELERRGQTVAPGAQPTPTGGGSFVPDAQPALIERDRWYKMSDLERIVAIQAFNLKSKNECESRFLMQLSKGSLVGLCVAAGIAGGLAGFSFTWLVLWLGGLAICKFIKWLILGFCDDVNSKQVESIEAE